MRTSISAVLIVKNEESVLERCLRSLDGVDETVVLDTGSTDRTVEVAERLGAKVARTVPIVPFHFAEARNRADALAMGRWVLTMDADEVAKPGCVEAVREAASRWPLATGFNVGFLMRAESGDKVVPIKKLKVARRGRWAWRYRVHERLFPTFPPAIVRDVPEAVVEHLPVADKSGRHAQNLELLRLCVGESPEYLRAARQLGLELMLRKEWDEAIPHIERFAEESDEGPLEESEALSYVGRCHAEAGRLDVALLKFDEAWRAAPERREPLFHAALALIKAARLDEATERLKRLLTISAASRPDYALNLEAAWGGMPQEMLDFCGAQIGEAKVRLAVLRGPDGADPRLGGGDVPLRT